jgi:hypothetical protein
MFGEATNVSNFVKHSMFTNNTLRSTHGDTYCGGAQFSYGGSASFITNSVEHSIFANNTLISEVGSAYAGGISITFYAGTVSSVNFACVQSVFQRNLLVARGDGGSAYGGGVFLFILVASTDVNTTCTQSSLTENTLQCGENGDVMGGGIMLFFTGIFTNALTRIGESRFVENTLLASEKQTVDHQNFGAGVTLVMQSFSGIVQTIISDSTFLRNAIRSPGGQGAGGAVYFTSIANASLLLLRCIIRANYARSQGGGVSAVQSNSNPPANLLMNVSKYEPRVTPHYACSPTYSSID